MGGVSSRRIGGFTVNALLDEALDMLEFKDECMSQFVGCIVDERPYGIAYEYQAKGSLQEILILEQLQIDDEFGLVLIFAHTVIP